MAADFAEELKTLDATLTGIETVLDVDGLRRRAEALENEAADPDLWSDQDRAQSVTRRLSSVRGDISRVEACQEPRDGGLMGGGIAPQAQGTPHVAGLARGPFGHGQHGGVVGQHSDDGER